MNDPSQPLKSPNFVFLAKHDPMLVRYAALAERYVFEDPNTALIKLRQLAETLAEMAAAYAAITIEPNTKLTEVLNRLWDRRIIDQKISQLFHSLRKTGNKAVHDHEDEQREALYQLKLARQLAVWFHKTFGKEPNFNAGPFVPPPDPRDVRSELQEQLRQMRDKMAQLDAALHEARQQAKSEEELRQLAEQEAARAFEEQAAAMELAAETEQILSEERQQFELRMKTLAAEREQAPREERELVVQQAQQQSEELELDEVETRHLIDEHLREAGWEADSQKLRYSKGIRPVKGRNIAIAEWPTANGPADYCLFAGLTPVGIAEAKRRNLNVASAIGQAQRYSKGFQAEDSFQSNGGPWSEYKIPFLFSANGRPFLQQVAELSGIWFRDARREVNHPRPLEDWYTPQGLLELLKQDLDEADRKLTTETTDYLPLRDYQKNAIREIEEHIADGDREMLVAMATGTGNPMAPANSREPLK